MLNICFQVNLLILFIIHLFLQLQTLVSNDSQVNVSRSLSKMKSLFMSLDKDFLDGSDRKTFYNKQYNNFYSPMAAVMI